MSATLQESVSKSVTTLWGITNARVSRDTSFRLIRHARVSCTLFFFFGFYANIDDDLFISIPKPKVCSLFWCIIYAPPFQTMHNGPMQGIISHLNMTIPFFYTFLIYYRYFHKRQM